MDREYSHHFDTLQGVRGFAWWLGGMVALWWTCVGLNGPFSTQAQEEASDQKRVGRLLRVGAPITSNVDLRIRRVARKFVDESKRNGQWPVLIFELQPGSSDFGKSYDLADFVASLTGATTVAYIPETVRGHSLLVAMACDQIVMAEDAKLGEAGLDEETISPAKRSLYVDIANRRRTVPADLALGMLDPALEVWEVETDVSREFVRTDRLEQLRKEKTFDLPAKPLIPVGEAGLFTGREARALGIVSYLAEDRGAVAKGLALPREAMSEDPSLDGAWRPMQVQIKGPVTPQLVSQTIRVIQDEIGRSDANLIVVWIDSPGGSPESSISLANYLASFDPGQRRTVAYIPSEARADAAYVALACDQVVMRPDALLGGDGAANLDEALVELTAESVRENARQKHRSVSLAAALVDPNLVVYRYTRKTDGLVEYMSEVEARRQPDADAWQQGEAVTQRGQLFRANGQQALEFGLVDDVVDSFAELKQLYSLETDPRLVEPGWADTLLDALRLPSVAWFLLLIGAAALYAELQAPGIGVGAFISAVCFLVFFWSNYLGGTTGWLEVLLFLLGIACLMMELFVLPGFGVFGLGGAALVLVSVVLATQTFVFMPRNEYQVDELQQGLLTVAAAGAGAVVLISLLNRYLPRAPVLNRVVLEPPTEDEQAEISRREALASFGHLVGRRGTTVTQLTPAGKANIEGDLLNVISDGDLIARGEQVVVVEARGNRVVVRRAE